MALISVYARMSELRGRAPDIHLLGWLLSISAALCTGAAVFNVGPKNFCGPAVAYTHLTLPTILRVYVYVGGLNQSLCQDV